MTATLTPGSTTCRPRFATPRDESFPTHGPAIAAVAEKLGKPLMQWQRNLVDVAYEYDPVSGRFRYDEVDTTVPRQSGKTTVTLAKKVYRLTRLAREWGPQRATYTAQTRLAARKKLERDFSETLRSSRSFREIVNAKARPQRATEWRLSLNNGSEAIQFGTGSFLQIDAPSRTGGHGDTLDDGDIDEAFAHSDDTVEAAMRPAMATRRNAQLWVTSTAGDARSAYLWRKVVAGRAAHEAGQHGNVCYIEYSADDDADPGDPAVWWGCMPALGVTISEDFIRGEWERAQRKGQEGVDTFRRAYLNQWPQIPVLGDSVLGGAFPLDAWDALADPDAPRGVAPVFGLATAPDRSWSAIAVAWWRSDGAVQTMLVDYQRDTSWVSSRADNLLATWGGRVLADVPSRGLVAGATEPSLAEQAQADNELSDRIVAGTVRHGNQPALNTAIRAAKWKPSGDTRVLVPGSSADISPVIAAALAVHGLTTTPASGGWMVGL